MELEPAFVLRRALRGPNLTIADVIGAIDYAVPAIEIIDSRVRNWAIGLPRHVGRQRLHRRGHPRRHPPHAHRTDLRDTRGVLRFNDREVIAGTTGNILGNPLAAVAWLVNRLADYDVEFEPGQLILPGSCLQAVPMNEAGRWSGTFEGWGTIEFDVTTVAN